MSVSQRSKERHQTVLSEGRTFHFWRVRARSEFPCYDGRGNPWLWFGAERLPSGERDVSVCGVKTLREAKAHYGLGEVR